MRTAHYLCRKIPASRNSGFRRDKSFNSARGNDYHLTFAFHSIKYQLLDFSVDTVMYARFNFVVTVRHEFDHVIKSP
jgi:hypothetical protein